MAFNGEAVAIYWDFENLHASLVDQAGGQGAYQQCRFKPQEELVDVAAILEFALTLGPLAINRAFANWVSFNRYRQTLLQSAIELIQVFPPGPSAKNGADIKLCLDVMEDMARFPHISSIIVVGGDSDYMPLSYKVKAAGRTLYGVGSQRSTNPHWARSCHEFKYYESLIAPSEVAVGDTQPAGTAMGPAAPEASTLATSDEGQRTQEIRELLDAAVASKEDRLREARDLVTKAIARLSQSRGEAWIQKARIRPFIQRMDPTYHESTYGFSTFNELIASMGEVVEVRKGEFDHELRLKV